MPVIEVNSVNQFDDIRNDRDSNDPGYVGHGKTYMVVDFNATWCGPCKRFAPEFLELSEIYNKHFYFCAVDVDELEELTTRFNITGLPTFLVLNVYNNSIKPDIVYPPIVGVNSGTRPELVNLLNYLSDQIEASDQNSSSDSDF